MVNRAYNAIDHIGQLHLRKDITSMYTKFLNLEAEKKDRIINAAIREFAQKGYDHASTNEIAKEAAVAKGLLFHYFQNKKGLFLFLYDYCIELNMSEFYKKIDLDEKDFFMRLRQIQRIKWELLNKYPEIFKFLQAAYLETSSEVKSDLEHQNKELALSSTKKVFEGIDTSLFKEGIDINKVIKIVLWTFQGFADEVLEEAKLSAANQTNYEKAFAQAEAYIQLLKSCFYK
jgi:TetR/AcrR family transcriptional regulator